MNAEPIPIEAADLRRALDTGLTSMLMTSAATGYDVKVWDRMLYFYDTTAWARLRLVVLSPGSSHSAGKL